MFVKVENGSVTQTLGTLPRAHTFTNGDKTGNFDLMSIATQVQEGYYPLIKSKPAYNSNFQRLVLVDYTINTDDVTANYVVEDIPINELRSSKINEVELLLDASLANSTLVFGNSTFNFSEKMAIDAAELRAAITGGLTFPSGFSWTDASGDEVAMDEAGFNLFGQAIAGHKLGLIGTAKVHIANIKALTDLQAIIDYDVTIGW